MGYNKSLITIVALFIDIHGLALNTMKESVDKTLPVIR